MESFSKIIRSVVTEKSSNLQVNGKYSFAVRRDANKFEIKKAIEKLYGVEVKSVNIMIAPPKKRLAGRGKVITKRPIIRKAIITLKGGKTIDPFKLKDVKSKA